MFRKGVSVGLFLFALLWGQALMAMDIYVSPLGNDASEGSREAPFYSLKRALAESKTYAGREEVNIWLLEGHYYLEKTLVIGPEHSGTREFPLSISAFPGATVKIKGSKLLEGLEWKRHTEDVYVAELPPKLSFDQLFVNGKRQVRARYPNYDYDNPLRGGKGYLQVAGGTDRRYDEWIQLKPEDFKDKDWKRPSTGIVHAFQSHNWGNMQYRIKGVDKEQNKIFLGEGGWQLQRVHGIGGKGKNASWFFIENIFEELNVAGEWFLDEEKKLLYYYPEEGVDLNNAVIEVPVAKDLIQIKGTSRNPVKYITINGIDFTQSRTTFMEAYEPLARGDWAIHRGGALFLEGAENCTISDCNFEFLGGNGVFMSAYNRNNTVSDCRFYHLGESAVALVGSLDAVRFYQTWDDREIYGKDWNEMRKNMDLRPGPKSDNYPKNCIVENNMMHDFGDYGKQVAGVYISMSHKITVAHNTIYNCPRAGICINDGTWGGHLIEYNDIWETVRETGEHGPFNSWGRERQWLGAGGSADTDFIKEYVKLDALDPVIVRNNRIANYRKSISAGNWTIDLDDGSSFYEIYNNLNLGSTIKLRDGMFRKVFNNISVSAVPLGWHVWPKASEDEVYQNIFVISGSVPGKEAPTDIFIRPIRLPEDAKWSNHYDHNLYWNVNFPTSDRIIKEKNLRQWRAEGYDLNSKMADPLFVDPENGDYRVREGSPALDLGFKNFPMDEFGHQMTKAVPFSREFEKEIEVRLLPDKRMDGSGSIRYTTDGTEPTVASKVYTVPLVFEKSTDLKFRSFDGKGHGLGFVNSVRYTRVDKLEYPSWLATLLSGSYVGSMGQKELQKDDAVVIYGAAFVNMADDPDLIDASGGYNTGCFIKTIYEDPKGMWKASGLGIGWVVQAVNGEEVIDTGDLKRLLGNAQGKTLQIKAVRNYREKTFKVGID
ncbi:right-handed parallel beta-helix repeat-containing protein [Pseudozobellia thermophila]|uniref:Right handed beta helix region n=1 Tax=Pseudozobellia thermophila TaxID=192903 RepID=A0A1M6G1S0_9FLAO|nr:right-handed parallel beta-helix repeat-containing protein [Pseudozobellia thermophila]SHJ03869.1 Right handed beta helix region [Pseudozobellia thermophila]